MENNNQIPVNEEQTKEPTSKELLASVIPEDGGIDEQTKKSKKSNIGGRLVFEFNAKTIKYIFGAAVLIILFAWGINNTDKVSGIISGFFSIISPFITGFCFAFIINVLMRPMEKIFDKLFKKSSEKIRNKIRRPVCLILSTVIIIGLLFALIFMILPEFMNTLQNLIKAFPRYAAQVETWIEKIIAFAAIHGVTLPEMSFNADTVLNTLKNFINSSGIVDKTLTFTGSLVSGIVNLIVAIAFSLYLLAQKETLSSQAKRFMQAFLPKKNDVNRIVNFIGIVDRTFTSFLTGQLTEAVIIGVLCFIGMLIFKMPYAAVISVLVGFTALIPVFGAFIGTAIGAFLILFDDPMKAVWFVVFIVVLQQLEGNLIYPKVVGKSVGLPGIWVLAAVTIGGTLGGVLGILLSVPFCAVIYCLLAYLVDVRLKKKEELESEQEKSSKKKQPCNENKK
ncbi:MAG: AI-2E family transporter [Ruminococcaceae bacterium]|nr:AI-2E family transporter [Oscillospiraceae bacterium]